MNGGLAQRWRCWVGLGVLACCTLGLPDVAGATVRLETRQVDLGAVLWGADIHVPFGVINE